MCIENKINLNAEESYYMKLIGFFIGIVILGIFCYIDDVKGLPAIVKLIGQIIAGIVIAIFGIRINNTNIEFIDNILNSNIIFVYILTVAWVVGITNAINLIDGLDGLSSGITLISCLSLVMALRMYIQDSVEPPPLLESSSMKFFMPCSLARSRAFLKYFTASSLKTVNTYIPVLLYSK